MSDQVLEFVERLPYTPLLIDLGYNVVKVRLTSASGEPLKGQSISWRIPPQYTGVRLESNKPTETDADGIATNRILIRPDAELPALMTVSAWLTDDLAGTQSANHVSTLFACVWPNVACSFTRRWAHKCKDTDTTDVSDDKLITATATILDDTGEPIRGLAFQWRMTPNAPTEAFERLPDGTLSKLKWRSTPFYEVGYPVKTNDDGQSTILFCNIATTLMGVAPTVDATLFSYRVVFTDVDLSDGQGPSIELPLDGQVLHLDKYPEKVPVGLPYQSGAAWLNGEIVQFFSHASPPTYLRSLDFIPGLLNKIGYVSDLGSGNGQDSQLVAFKVDGRAAMPQPTPGGTLPSPELVAAGVSIVNDAVISGGLRVFVPPYGGNEGDVVSLALYLNGWYQYTYPHENYLSYTRTLSKDEAENGLFIVADEKSLLGYGHAPNGDLGTFRAQHTVAPRVGEPRYSVILTLGLDTISPE